MALRGSETALTKPGTGILHNFPEAAGFGDGFYLAFSEQNPAKVSTDTYVQQFSASGKAGTKTKLWTGGGQSPEIADLGNGKLLAVSLRNVNGDMTNVAAALIDGKTGKVLTSKTLGIKENDHVNEIASLGGGKAALVVTSADTSLRYKTKVYILDSKLGVKTGATLQDSGYLVTKDYWQVLDRGSKGATAVWLDNADNGIYAQLLDNGGKATGKKLSVNTDKIFVPSAFDKLNQSVKATATDSGGFVVSWSGRTDKSDAYDVWFRMYDAAGKAKTSVTMANQSTKDTQYKQDVTMLDKGNFAVTWVENSIPKLAETHYIRFYDSSAKALSGEIAINKKPWGFTSLDTEWIKLKDGSLAEVYAEGGAVKGVGVPKPVFGTGKAETFGTSGNDLVIAGGGSDTLSGGRGQDILIGGAGSDKLGGGRDGDLLTGDAGADRFIFDSKLSATENVDAITDFNVADDTIALDRDAFAGLGKAGPLAAALFKDLGIAGAFIEADDRILYDSRTGALSYDRDGAGTAAAVKFAQLENRALLTAADFIAV